VIVIVMADFPFETDLKEAPPITVESLRQP